MKRTLSRLILTICALLCPTLASAQGVRWDGITLSPSGRPVSASVAVCTSPGLTTTAAQVIGNTAILTMSSNPITAGFAANMQIAVSGFTGGDTYFNVGTLQPFSSTVTITAVSATTITYPLTHANASASTVGSVFQLGNVATPCAPLASIFNDAAETSPITQPGFVSSNIGNVGFYVSPGNYAIQFYGTGVTTYLQPLSLSMVFLSGANVFTSNNVFKGINYAQVVDLTPANLLLFWGTTDPGVAVNAAYAALPSVGGTIYVVSSTTTGCANYSTPIVLTVSGKYVKLEGITTSGATGASSVGGACLNYVPVTATSAITLDYVPTAQSPLSSAHGLRNITLTNNGCLTSGGCGSLAIGINTGVTNAGTWGATMDNVGIVGFGVGYQNANNLSVQVHWRNPQFVFNTVAAKTDQMTGFWIDAGQIEGNGTGLAATGGSSQTEYIFNGPSFFANTAVDIDVSASSATGSLFCGGCHFEKGGSSANARTINGPLNIVFDGGVMETDKTIGTDDWMINASGSLLDIRGTRFLASDTVTSIIVANSPVRGQFNGSMISQGHFTNRITGANAANISDCSFAGSSTAAAASPCYFEAPFQINGQASQPTGKAGFANLFYYPADSALEFNLNNAGNFKVAATNLAQSWSNNQTGMPLVTPTIGGGTTITKYYVVAGAITPAVTNANTCAEQTFTPAAFNGVVNAGDNVFLNGSATMAANGVFPIMGVRAVANGVAITYCNSTAGNLTAPAVTITVTGTR